MTHASRNLAIVIVLAAAGYAECPPLIRGALWWIAPTYYEWSAEQFASTLDAQRAAGFDLLWLMNCPELLRRAGTGDSEDVLKTLLDLAADRGMRAIVDLPRAGWYGETDAGTMVDATRAYVDRMHTRFGSHHAFLGWYLNYEINPIAAEDSGATHYWRTAWKGIVEACNAANPNALVTISPFFLLDKERKRGFVYQSPEEFATWWGATLRETGIDVLMLQDSGEHLAFFTLEDREPFWAATAKACRESGAQFWLNVESAEVPATSWEQYLQWEREKTVRYEVLPMDKLAAKLRLAARNSDRIVNWGYFPYMNPHEPPGTRVEGAAVAYSDYLEHVAACDPPASKRGSS